MKEKELVLKCIQNDRLAQRQLYDVYGPKLMHLCLRYMQNTEEAEEVFHDSLLKVFKKINTFNFKSSLVTWIHKIGMYTALDKIRLNKKLLMVNYMTNLENDIANEEEEWDELPKEEMVMHWISKLSANKQLILNMHVYENIGHQEIANLLDMSYNAVRATYSRARKEIIELYKEELKVHGYAK